MEKNQFKIQSFFEKYAYEYSKENYETKKNKFMITRLNTIMDLNSTKKPNQQKLKHYNLE